MEMRGQHGCISRKTYPGGATRVSKVKFSGWSLTPLYTYPPPGLGSPRNTLYLHTLPPKFVHPGRSKCTPRGLGVFDPIFQCVTLKINPVKSFLFVGPEAKRRDSLDIASYVCHIFPVFYGWMPWMLQGMLLSASHVFEWRSWMLQVVFIILLCFGWGLRY